METEALGAAQNVDFSLIGMFMRSTALGKAVMLGLIAASFWSWTVAVDRWLAYRRVRGSIELFEDAFWSGQPLDALYDRVGAKPRSAIERVFAAGMSEWRRSYDATGGLIPDSASRIERALDVALAREGEALGARLPVLATVGAISPFVGLFGTVMGIIVAFEQIAQEQNTNLATVAPGIAEALVTTAIGLLAAIPAVIFYNALAGQAQKLAARLEGFADEFTVILSRQMVRSAA